MIWNAIYFASYIYIYGSFRLVNFKFWTLNGLFKVFNSLRYGDTHQQEP